jgi:hypothetical protein
MNGLWVKGHALSNSPPGSLQELLDLTQQPLDRWVPIKNSPEDILAASDSSRSEKVEEEDYRGFG